ncbi:MAG: class I SAM-dependent methyltransferase [Bryobacteraceae bacterium]
MTKTVHIDEQRDRNKLDALRARFPWPADRPDVPENLHGWNNSENYRLFDQILARRPRVIVEIGAWCGQSTQYLARRTDGVVIAIDHWKGSTEHQWVDEWQALLPTLYETFLTNLWDWRDRVIPVRLDSISGMQLLAELGIEPDAIYIDAAHEYEAVKQDIETAQRLFPGALLCGDDFTSYGVAPAVVETIPDHHTDGRVWRAAQKRPLFSICHTTGRPEGWQASARAWMERAANRADVEYVLCVDERWGFDRDAVRLDNPAWVNAHPSIDRLAWNDGRQCMVDGYAAAAEAATGHVLILNSDDMYPPENWDQQLLDVIRSQPWSGDWPHWLNADFTIEVSSGTDADQRGLMVLQILSRGRYERWGYAMYPEFEGVFADDDFTAHSRADGNVLDAQHIVVEHRHADETKHDAVYQHQNAAACYHVGRAIFQRRVATQFADAPQRPEPVFSICHATARPDQWRKIFEQWTKRAANPELVEYVLTVDERWGFGPDTNLAGPDKICWNKFRRNCVDAWNLAAKAAQGKVLILAADDVEPPQDWDRDLFHAIAEHFHDHTAAVLDREFVPHVHTGTVAILNGKHFATGLLMLSKARLDRLTYALHPEYESMWSDLEFWAHADQDNCVIDARRVRCIHHHPILECKSQADVKRGDWKKADAVYAVQNEAALYDSGEAIFRRHAALNFSHDTLRVVPDGTPVMAQERSISIREAGGDENQKTVAVVLPGETFSSTVVNAWTGLLIHLLTNYNLIPPYFAYSSNVYITRSSALDALLKSSVQPDYVLWLDDDNVLSPEHFEMLRADLDAHPEAAAVGAWCWVQPQGYDIEATMSAGVWTADGRCAPMPLVELAKAQIEQKLLEVGYFGFPAVLMRYETLRLAGPNPFAPWPTPGYGWGFAGEDASFCRAAATRSGCRFFIDPRVQIPHYKTRNVGSTPIPDAVLSAARAALAEEPVSVTPSPDTGQRKESN